MINWMDGNIFAVSSPASASCKEFLRFSVKIRGHGGWAKLSLLRDSGHRGSHQGDSGNLMNCGAIFRQQFRKELERIKRSGRDTTRVLEAIARAAARAVADFRNSLND